jgi:hypothetical protein
MPRIKKSVEQVRSLKTKTRELVDKRELLGFGVPKKKRKRSFSRSRSKVRVDTDMLEIDERIERGDFSKMTPTLYVALFCWIHEAVYQISCIEEVRPNWGVVQQVAKTMLDEEFGGNEQEFVEYLQWVAKNEERRESYRRSTKSTSTWRMQWRDVFMRRTILGDWRLDRVRRTGVA